MKRKKVGQRRGQATKSSDMASDGPSITFRTNNADHPKRKQDFVAVLKKRGANASDVLNNFVDAYIECDGIVTFPVKFACEDDKPKKKK